jgi:hypothetical protein
MVSKIADAIIEGRTETESAGDAAAYGEPEAVESYAPEEPVTTMAEAEAGA